jgi:hypothetical protein
MKAPTRTYEDIIGLPRPVSPRRTRLSPLGRAAQFAPFAALSGFEEEIDETARLTDRCPELSEEDFLRLNAALYELMGCLHEQPEVTLTLFQPDEKKPGGAFISVTGHVRRIDEANREVILTDGRSIPFRKIHGIARISRAG